MLRKQLFLLAGVVIILAFVSTAYATSSVSDFASTDEQPTNKADYDARLRQLAHLSTATTSGRAVETTNAPVRHLKRNRWPAKAPYPKAGAVLPFKRIVAFYGNFHSKRMGVLGEYPEDEVLRRLGQEVTSWTKADPTTPVIPAIHYVAITAQGSPGPDGRYRLRMPVTDLERALAMADKVQGLLILDVQVGKSSLKAEVPTLDSFLKLPQVHLGIDPEFAIKGASKPGEKIGTVDAAEVNWVIDHLSKIVDQNHLPPKVLVVHRFVPSMVTRIRLIHPTPQVQVVIDMDGWGRPEDKETIYRICVERQPVQFTGFKVFFRNDRRPAGSRLMVPAEILELTPRPIYIQYQ